MSPDRPVRVVRITWSTALLGVGGVIAVFLLRTSFVAAHRILGWAAASLVVAVLIEGISTWLGRWIPRVLAVLLTFLVIGGAVGLTVYGVFDDLDREVARLEDDMPPAIDELESRDDSLGRLASELELTRRADSFLEEVDNRVGSGTGALAENAPTLPVYFVCAILTIFLLVYGPRIAQGALEQVRDGQRRDVVGRVVVSALHRARRTVWALIGQGVVTGGVSGLLAWFLDLPAPIVLGLIAGALAVLPDVGILLGTVPTVALAAALQSVPIAALLLAGALVAQLFEAFYLRRRIRDSGVDVGPAVVWIVALVGYTVYGPGMAFYGVAYAIFVLAVVDQIPAVRDEA